MPVNDNYEKFQERYEMFCGGYLLFYDEVVRNKVVDHTIHFKWSLEKGTGKYSVTIYLSPEPQTTIKNYVKKSGMGYNEFYKEKLLASQDFTVSGGGVDPPPPPPPPPPPMHY